MHIYKKTPIARHQNVAYYVPSNKPLSTNIADRHAHVMQEVVTIHRKFLKVCLPVALVESSHMGKANLPENAASAKQCQVDSKYFHSLLLPLSGSSNLNKF